MSELTLAEYNDPSLLDWQRWMEVRGDEVVFLDPATGRALCNGRRPQWLQDDPRLAEGDDLLKSSGARGHKVTLAFGQHSYAHHLDLPDPTTGKPDRTWYESMYTAIDAVALERVGATAESVKRDIDSFKAPSDKTVITRFDRQAKAIADYGVPYLLPDIPGSSDIPLDRLILDGLRSLMPIADRPIHQDIARRLAIPLQIMREWFISANYMLEATALEQATGKAPHVLFPIGGNHYGLSRIFSRAGMRVDEVHLVSASQRQEYIRRAELRHLGRMTVAEMNIQVRNMSPFTRIPSFRGRIVSQRVTDLRQTHTRSA